METAKKSLFSAESSLKLFRGFLKRKTLTPEEELILFMRVRGGDLGARNELVLSYSKLVYKYAFNFHFPRIPFDDLVQEGCLGLIDAADRFNPAWNVSFITFASQFVIGRMKNLVKEIYGFRSGVVSLFDKYGEDADLILIDFLSATPPFLTDSDSHRNESADKLISRIKKTITEQEYNILLEYFGIGKGSGTTLKDLSEKFDLSPSRIHQIKKKVIRRIRKSLLRKGGEFN